MGLNIKDSLLVVKDEPVESSKDSGLFFFETKIDKFLVLL